MKLIVTEMPATRSDCPFCDQDFGQPMCHCGVYPHECDYFGGACERNPEDCPHLIALDDYLKNKQ